MKFRVLMSATSEPSGELVILISISLLNRMLSQISSSSAVTL